MSSLNIPKWISDIYYKVDKNKDGITQDELDNLDRAKEGIGSIYQFEAGMDLNSFVEKNRSVFSGYINFEGDPTEGRQVIIDSQSNKLSHTNAGRNTSQDSEKSLEVGQGEYSIAEYSEDTPYMQTYGIGPCVAVTIYDKTSKKGFLTHIDTPGKAKSLRQVLETLSSKGFDLKNCEARIIGGQTGSSMETVKTIQQCIENTAATIVEMDVFGYGTRAIQLNLDTGEVTDYQETIHTRNDTDIVTMRTLSSNTLTEYKKPQHGL